MDVDQQVEELRREREEKVRLIAAKKLQVEELRKKRAEREAALKRDKEERARSAAQGVQELPNVDTLVKEILGIDSTPGARPAAEGPLAEMAAERRGATAKKEVTLQTDLNVTSISFDPEESSNYERGVQTDDVAIEASAPPKSAMVSAGQPYSVLTRMAERARQKQVKPDDALHTMRSVRPEGGLDTAGGKTGGSTPRAESSTRREAAAPGVDTSAPSKELSTEERERLMNTPDFQSFFDRATLLVERHLGKDDWDTAIDFKNLGINDEVEEGEGSGFLKHVEDYGEEKHTQGRAITDLKFSPHRSELFLASYGLRANPDLSDPDGIVLLWNLAMKARPEVTFTCQSSVLAAQCHRFDPALYFGGTYAGGLVLWDTRAKAGPVQRTALSGKSHSHPIHAMQQVGTQNATNLVSASNDGRLCVWSLAMLVHPQDTIDLKLEQRSQKRDLSIMSLCFPENETNVLYVGAEDGTVAQVQIHGSKVGVTDVFDGHEGPVTGLDLHPHGEGVESAQDVAISSCFDWSVKLWNVKQHSNPVLSLDIFEDYVYDVKWHPSHPAAFASVDGEGHVDLWNLNRNTETPVVRCEHPQNRKLALNRCSWSSDGRKFACGDSEGMLSVYAADKALANPRNDDYTQFKELMTSLQPIMPRVGRDASSNFDPAPRPAAGRY